MWIFLFVALLLLQGAYGWWLYRSFDAAAASPPRSAPGDADALPPLSVIVAVRDEEEHLPELLRCLAAQTHPRLEVVIVNDASVDGTAALLDDWTRAAPHRRVLTVDEPRAPRKKRALARGIAAARHDLLAFTDADCTPPPTWAAALARRHAAAEMPQVLVGYSPMLKRPGLLNALARYETLLTGAFTAAAIGGGRPYMAVGRNLSYPRAVFDAVAGFTNGASSMSGDDDLFVQAVQATQAATVTALTDPATHVPTHPPPTWRAWIHRKRRHVSAGWHYARAPQVHLTLYQTSATALWAAPLLLGPLGAGLLAARLLIHAALVGSAARTFKARDLLGGFLLWELGYALYHLTVVPLGLLRAPRRWDPNDP